MLFIWNNQFGVVKEILTGWKIKSYLYKEIFGEKMGNIFCSIKDFYDFFFYVKNDNIWFWYKFLLFNAEIHKKIKRQKTVNKKKKTILIRKTYEKFVYNLLTLTLEDNCFFFIVVQQQTLKVPTTHN